jgi:hypothetical protein
MEMQLEELDTAATEDELAVEQAAAQSPTARVLPAHAVVTLEQILITRGHSRRR